MKISSQSGKIYLIILINIFLPLELARAIELNGTDKELIDWRATPELRKRFPYFVSGHDNDGHPIFVIEYGKWDLRGFLESDLEDDKKELDKFFDKCALVITTPELVPPAEGEAVADKFVVISDIEGYDAKQLIHTPSVQSYLSSVRKFVDALRKRNYNIKKGYFVNSNFLFSSMWNLMKPIFGETISFMELYGTKSDKWKPVLLANIDPSQLPEWLGGVKDHKPIKVYP